MLNAIEIENVLYALKPQLMDRFHIGKIGYFGSFARDEQTDKSDVDILVEFTRPIGWEFFDLQDLLEQKFSRKVDLVTVNGLRPQLKDTILSQVKYV